MPSNTEKMSLLVQLKILKELRILNKNIRAIVRDKVGRNDAYKNLSMDDLEDVRDVINTINYGIV